jgi:hypothetical protein
MIKEFRPILLSAGITGVTLVELSLFAQPKAVKSKTNNDKLNIELYFIRQF